RFQFRAELLVLQLPAVAVEDQCEDVLAKGIVRDDEHVYRSVTVDETVESFDRDDGAVVGRARALPLRDRVEQRGYRCGGRLQANDELALGTGGRDVTRSAKLPGRYRQVLDCAANARKEMVIVGVDDRRASRDVRR